MNDYQKIVQGLNVKHQEIFITEFLEVLKNVLGKHHKLVKQYQRDERYCLVNKQTLLDEIKNVQCNQS